MQPIPVVLLLAGLGSLTGTVWCQQTRLDVPKLMQDLQSGTPSKMASAASLLGNSGVKGAAPALSKALRYPDSKVQNLALLALNNLGAVSETAEIRRLLRSSNPEIRANAALTLLHFEDQASLPTILEMLQSESLELRRRMTDVFRVLPTPEAEPALIAALEDDDSQVRQRAIMALGVLGLPSSLEKLEPFLDDSDQQLRMAAFGAVSNIAPEKYRDRLLEQFHSGVDLPRKGAVLPLTRLGSAEAEELLLAEIPASPMLNYFHAREACEKIRNTRVLLRKIRYISLEKVLALLSERIGMPIEISPSASLNPKGVRLYNNTATLGHRPEVFGLLTNLNSQLWEGIASPVSWIIDGDTIRIVSPEEATAFFKAEAAKRRDGKRD